MSGRPLTRRRKINPFLSKMQSPLIRYCTRVPSDKSASTLIVIFPAASLEHLKEWIVGCLFVRFWKYAFTFFPRYGSVPEGCSIRQFDVLNRSRKASTLESTKQRSNSVSNLFDN